MLTELHGKGGDLCRQARAGQVRCPLIVRPTSEDVITGHLVEALRCINPYWWLSDLLNAALGARRFRRRVYRRLRIEPWVNKPPYPRELLPWDEGSTQVDVCIGFENPPTTIFVEAKYGSDLSSSTANSHEQHGFPGDQLIRNIRVGLLECGYIDGGGSLFDQPIRDFIQVVLSPRKGHPLVDRYRDPEQLRRSIPHPDRLATLPVSPFVGGLSFADIAATLRRNSRFLTRGERHVAENLCSYLEYKSALVPTWSAIHRDPPHDDRLP